MVLSSMRLHLESCWVGVSLPQWGKVTCEGKIESRDSNSSYFLCHLVPTALLSPCGSSLFTPEAALLRVGLCATLVCLSASIIYSISYVQFLPYGPYWDRAITATAFSCIASVSPQTAAPSSDAAGRRGRDVCLQVAVEGGCGPTAVSWVPEPRALVLGSQPWALLIYGLYSKAFKSTHLAFLSGVPTSCSCHLKESS